MNSSLNQLIKNLKKRKEKLELGEIEIPSNKREISEQLHENLQKVKEALGNSSDLAIWEFKMGKPSFRKVAIIYINGLTEMQVVGSFCSTHSC
jgi:spore germination protein KA